MSEKAAKPAIDKTVVRRAVIAALCVVCAVCVFGAALFVHDRKKEFENSDKLSYAMGTVVDVKFYGKDTGSLVTTATELVPQLEDVISANKESSALAMINRHSGSEASSEVLADVLRQCARVSASSGGRFDVTVGALTSLWDFDSEKNKIPDAAEIKKALGTVGYEKIDLGSTGFRTAKGQQIDLGAVGKGFACDVLAEYFGKSGADGMVASVGGSICVCGKRNKAGDKWRVAVRHPREENKFLGTIKTEGGAFISTSGDYEKYFEKDGKRYHHILDAATGYPAESDLCSVTVICGSGLLSDALSTACFILGSEKAAALAEEYGAAAILVDRDLNVKTVGEVDFEAAV